MIDSEHRRYEEDLAAYLLGALGDEESRAFESHLRSCATCQAEQRWLRGAVELLPSSIEQLEPPPELRQRLMETVRAEAASEGARARGGRRPARRWSFALQPAVALGATAAIVLAGVGGYLIGNGGSENGGSSRIAAKPTAVQPDARAAVVRSGDAAVLDVQRLPRLPAGRVYEVWLMRSGASKPEPSSLFTVNRERRGAAGIPGGLRGVKQVLVTSEPAGGSSQPTTQPVLTVNL